MAIQHIYTSPQADVGDPTLVQPSDWNSVHAYTLQDAVSLSGNTAGALANISTGTLYLAGGNNLTLSQDGNSVTLSAFNQTLQTQNRFNLTLSGNTDGAMAHVSSGTLTLAGGNNITLSQAGNAVTIVGPAAGAGVLATSGEAVASANSVGSVTRYAAEDHRHAGIFSAGVSNVGNTSGDTGVGPGRIVFAGGNNITLSVGTAAGALQTVTISAANSGTAPPIATAVKGVSSIGSTGTVTRFAPEDHQHAGLHSINVGGNTDGATTAGAGSFMLAGGNNITLSGATAAGGMTLSVVGGAGGGGYSAGISTGGNTDGTSGTVASRLVFVGGSNVTLSQSVNGASATITVNQSNAALPYYLPTDPQFSTTKDFSASMSTIFLMPILVPTEMTVNKVCMLASAQTNVTSAANNTTYALTISRGVALYSYNGTSLALATSSSATPNWSYTSNISTGSFHSIRLHTMPLAATIRPGNYWIAWSFSSLGNRSAAGGSSNTTMAHSYYLGGNIQVLPVLGIFGSASDPAVNAIPYQGYYTAQSAAFPNSIGSNEINTSGTINLWFRLDGAISG